MEADYTVVSDIREIARLNANLRAQLRGAFRHAETRQITYPSGHAAVPVFFEKNAGDKVRAWSPIVQATKLANLFLEGEPNASKWLEITVQLNFPAGTYHRRVAGAFVRDSNGDLFVAHRGKLTRGNAGLHIDDVLAAFAPFVVEAADGAMTKKVILIAALDSPELPDKLFEFATEAREVANQLGASRNADSTGASPRQNDPNRLMTELSDYFDEFAGEGTSKGHAGGKRVVEHGSIVKALERFLHTSGKTKKSRAIDLAVVAEKLIDLFEVKTSARTTDVYTGTGQLFIHGECIKERFQLPVRRHLVLPDQPNALFAKHIAGKGAINIVTYTKSGDGYKFSGLKGS